MDMPIMCTCTKGYDKITQKVFIRGLIMIQAQTLKGFRDFLPEQAIKRQHVVNIIQKVFKSYGFDPLETPALEYAETLTGKYGEEGDKLLYLFRDNGDRHVGLRYDQTVPLSRVVAQYPELTIPFKRYQIQPVWRAENTQKGRYREFLQCDIDTVGTDSPLSDAEIIACVLSVAKQLKLPSPIISINDRTIFDQLELSKTEIILIDKLDKIGKEKVMEELTKIGTLDKFYRLEKSVKTDRLVQICNFLSQSGFEEHKDFRFDPFLARGLDYYTSTIFELKDAAYTAGSLAGGGRYDKLIGMFSGRELPAVGVAFGFDRLIDALEELHLTSTKTTETDVLVTIFSSDFVSQATTIANFLRNHGLATELYLDPSAKLDKQLKYANRKGIPYVIIQGSSEVEKNVVVLKDMKQKEQLELSIDEVVSKLVTSN